MNVQPLFAPSHVSNDLGGAVAYRCGECGLVYQLAHKDSAESCCNAQCTECGEPVQRGWTLCPDHRKEREDKRERERFEKAEKIALADYDGKFVYIDGADNDGYVPTEDVEEALLDMLGAAPDAPRPVPAWGWATNPKRAGFNLHDEIESQLGDEHHEDAFSQVNIHLLLAAQQVVDEALKDVVSYWSDETRAIVLPGVEELRRKLAAYDKLLAEAPSYERQLRRRLFQALEKIASAAPRSKEKKP